MSLGFTHSLQNNRHLFPLSLGTQGSPKLKTIYNISTSIIKHIDQNNLYIIQLLRQCIASKNKSVTVSKIKRGKKYFIFYRNHIPFIDNNMHMYPLMSCINVKNSYRTKKLQQTRQHTMFLNLLRASIFKFQVTFDILSNNSGIFYRYILLIICISWNCRCPNPYCEQSNTYSSFTELESSFILADFKQLLNSLLIWCKSSNFSDKITNKLCSFDVWSKSPCVLKGVVSSY